MRKPSITHQLHPKPSPKPSVEAAPHQNPRLRRHRRGRVSQREESQQHRRQPHQRKQVVTHSLHLQMIVIVTTSKALCLTTLLYCYISKVNFYTYEYFVIQ